MTDEEFDAYYERERANDPYAERHFFENQRKIEGIPVNPIQRFYFDLTPNEERPGREVDEWWGEPYITTQGFGKDFYEDYCERMKDSGVLETKDEWVKRKSKEFDQWIEAWKEGIRYDVRCLDGGAWDRSSSKGYFDNFDDALEFAKSLKRD